MERTRGSGGQEINRRLRALPREEQRKLVRLFRAIRKTQVLCATCGGGVFPFDKFCEQCGESNPGWDEAVFEHQFECTLAAFQEKECGNGHPELHEARSFFPERDIDYCSQCGVRVFFAPPP